MVALFSPVVGKLTFLGHSPGAAAVLDRGCQGSRLAGLRVHHVHVEAEQHAAVRVVILASHSACIW